MAQIATTTTTTTATATATTTKMSATIPTRQLLEEDPPPWEGGGAELFPLQSERLAGLGSSTSPQELKDQQS